MGGDIYNANSGDGQTNIQTLAVSRLGGASVRLVWSR